MKGLEPSHLAAPGPKSEMCIKHKLISDIFENTIKTLYIGLYCIFTKNYKKMLL